MKKLYLIPLALILAGCGASDIKNSINDAKDTIVNSANALKDSTKSSSSPQDAVNRHNEIRAELYSDAPMVWDDTVAQTAQEYAEYLAKSGKFEHDSGSGYGENLYASSIPHDSYISAINSWYSEKKYYDYDTNSCQKGKVCGHYTQIIWKSSTHLGCGKATYKKGNFLGGTIIVCRYDPPGNFIGEKPY